MNWTCPHCERKLATHSTPAAASASNGTPSPGAALAQNAAPEGWNYARCGGCHGLAIVHRETGEALRIHKVEPRIEALPVASPIQIPPIPVSPAGVASADSSDLAVQPTGRPSRRILTSPVAQAMGVAVLFGLVTGAALLERRRAEMARAELVQAQLAARISAQVVAQEIPAEAPARQNLAPRDLATHDTVQTTAAHAESPETFEVQPRDRTASLHSGPGSEYAVLGVADPEERYPVLEMTRHWFKVPLGEAGQTAWLRRSEVEVRADAEAESKL